MATSPIRLKLFGPFQLLVEGTQINDVPRPLQELLAHLATAGPQGVDRAALALKIWPEADSERANFYLRRSLTQLRTALQFQKPRLETLEDGKIRLDLQDCLCDLREFDRACRLSEPSRWKQAATEYTGELLEGHKSDWVRQTRDQYREMYSTLLTRLALDAESSEDPESALDWLSRAMTADPLNEEICRQLMRCLGKKGDFPSMAYAFRDLRTSMKKQLGLSCSRETAELYRELLAEARLLGPAHLEDAPPVTKPIAVPRSLSPMIGRLRQAVEVERALITSRLVTLTGLGGIGKSRLAIHVTESGQEHFTGGVAYADMSRCLKATDVPHAIARALGNSNLAEAEFASKCELGKTLLVLDSVEHFAEATAERIALLLKASPDLHILSTSRRPLQLAGEHVVVLSPLELPSERSSSEQILSGEAVAFFLSCAARAAPSFRPRESNLKQIAELCRRLDGLPLALELAAVRLRTLPLQEILANLHDRFRLLEIPHEGRGNQKTLEGVLDWSSRLLSKGEMELWIRLASFPATWSVSAAQEVCADSALSRREIPGALSALVEHSLVVYSPDDGTYRMLETVRTYAQERLAARPWLFTEIQAQHAHYYLQIAGLLNFDGSAQDSFLSDQPNYSAAIDYFLASDEPGSKDSALQLTNRLFESWYRVGAVSEGLKTSVRVIRSLNEARTPALAECLFRTAGAAHWLFKIDLAQSLFHQAEGMADQLGLDLWVTESLRGRGEIAANEGRLNDANRLLTSALERFRAADDTQGEATCLGMLGYVKRQEGNLADAQTLTERALALNARLGNSEGRLWCMGSLAAIHLAANNPQKSLDLLLETLQSQEREGNASAQIWNLTMLGIAHKVLGHYSSAEDYLLRALGFEGRDVEDLRSAWPTLELGDVHRLSGNLQAAESTLNEALKMCRSSGSTTLEARALLRLSELALDKGDLVTAAAYLNATQEVLATIQAPQLLEELESDRKKLILRQTALASKSRIF